VIKFCPTDVLLILANSPDLSDFTSFSELHVAPPLIVLFQYRFFSRRLPHLTPSAYLFTTDLPVVPGFYLPQAYLFPPSPTQHVLPFFNNDPSLTFVIRAHMPSSCLVFVHPDCFFLFDRSLFPMFSYSRPPRPPVIAVLRPFLFCLCQRRLTWGRRCVVLIFLPKFAALPPFPLSSLASPNQHAASFLSCIPPILSTPSSGLEPQKCRVCLVQCDLIPIRPRFSSPPMPPLSSDVK